MPWIWMGRYCLDLNRIELVARAAGGEDSVTITFKNSSVIDLSGEDAFNFLAIWQEHCAARPGERFAAGVLTPVLVVPSQDPDSPGKINR